MSSEKFLRDLKPDETILIRVMGCVEVPLVSTAYLVRACSLKRSLTERGIFRSCGQFSAAYYPFGEKQRTFKMEKVDINKKMN